MISVRARRSRRRRATWAIVAIAAVLLAGCEPASTDLGTLGGATSSGADIQVDGVVVGASKNRQGFDHAYWYDPRNTTMVDLHPKGFVFSGAVGISDGGLVAGTVVTNELDSIGWVWHTSTGESMPLEKDPAFDRVVPTAVSSDGRIAGYGITTATGLTWTLQWSSDGTYLGVATPGYPSNATDINRDGTIVGLLGHPCCPTGAFVTGSGHGELDPWPLAQARAYGISDAGDIVGEGWNAFNAWSEPLAWDLDTMAGTPVPTLGGPGGGGLVDVNDDRIAVGWSMAPGAPPDGSGPHHAYCVSLRTGHVVDLGVATASAINDAGVVTGTKDGRAVTWPAGSCPH